MFGEIKKDQGGLKIGIGNRIIGIRLFLVCKANITKKYGNNFKWIHLKIKN